MQNGRVGFDSTLYHPSNFGIGFDNPTRNLIEPSALIEMQADDKGLLIPRMTADQMTAIAQPANSLLVYNTTDSVFNFYDKKTDSWLDLSKGDIWLEAENQNVILFPKYNFVGIGTKEPQTKLHIFAKTDDFNLEMPPPTIRIENNYNNKYYAWDIQNDKKNLKINFGENKESVIETKTKFVFTDKTYFGIGTETPMANLHINNQNQSSNSSNIILEAITNNLHTDGPPTPTKTFFEIENKKGIINFNYTTENNNQSILNYNPNSKKLSLLNESCTIDNEGTVTATKFVGTFEGITELWQENANDIFYPDGNVQIGNTPPNFHPYMKFQIVGEGDVFAGQYEHNKHPFAIFGNKDVLIMGTDEETACAYIQATQYDSKNGTNSKQRKNIKLVLNNLGGDVGIGTTDIPDGFKLAVDGKIICEKVKVVTDISDFTGADFVFDDDYDLLPITEVENFVIENYHLPDVPSAEEMQTNGLDLVDMNILLLQKIEELTLYIIEQNKRIEKLEEENKKLEEKNKQ